MEVDEREGAARWGSVREAGAQLPSNPQPALPDLSGAMMVSRYISPQERGWFALAGLPVVTACAAQGQLHSRNAACFHLCSS